MPGCDVCAAVRTSASATLCSPGCRERSLPQAAQWAEWDVGPRMRPLHAPGHTPFPMAESHRILRSMGCRGKLATYRGVARTGAARRGARKPGGNTPRSSVRQERTAIPGPGPSASLRGHGRGKGAGPVGVNGFSRRGSRPLMSESIHIRRRRRRRGAERPARCRPARSGDAL